MTLNKVIDRVRGSNRTISNKEYYKRLSFKAKYIFSNNKWQSFKGLYPYDS